MTLFRLCASATLALVVARGAASVQLPASSQSPPRTQILFLGTAGGPPLRADRSEPATLLTIDGRRYLIDCGIGTARRLVEAGVRAHLDDRNQTLNYRIREAETLKVPYMAVVGGREAEHGTVAVRTRGAGSKQEVTPLAEFVRRVQSEIASRSLTP